MNPYIRSYEELSMNAYPALKTLYYDGWVLRFSNGFGNRANCINPIYNAARDMVEKIDYCEKAYQKQGLTPVYKLTASSPGKLNGMLDSMGYQEVHPTFLMGKRISPKSGMARELVLENGIPDTWWDFYLASHDITDEKYIAELKAIEKKGVNGIFSGKVIVEGNIIGCGLCIMERGYAGLYSIGIAKEHRGQGYGYLLCDGLLKEAAARGAWNGYLQVLENNEAAVNLYRKLGFSPLYQYWYRRKEGV